MEFNNKIFTIAAYNRRELINHETIVKEFDVNVYFSKPSHS
jgi:IS30 family transposase